MSIVEEVGAQVRAAAEELPLGLLGQALEKFGLASERLRWVRQESANPMGVPELSSATEHAETAGYALRLAQEQLTAYLAAIGLAPDGAPPAAGQPQRRPVHDAPGAAEPQVATPEPAGEVRLRRWWSVRVAELTGGREGPAEQPDERVADSRELLHRVVRGVRAGDRDRLHRDLRGAHADVGLGLAAVAPPLLRDLASELLGHPPRGDDLARLHRELDGRVRDLLPGLPAPVLDTLLSRVCRMPPPRRGEGEQPHAADPAVTAGVLTGVLLDRLGRDLPSEGTGGAGGVRPDDGGATGGRPAGRGGEPGLGRLSEPGPPSGPTRSGHGRVTPWSGAPSRPPARDGVGRPRRGIDG
ncbi:hypothetical protein [Micromonospora sp. C95]|uniref:hypothetical protein n=1 Tax=Micromonospora sp. C95 TaxID=2824882 RepID=UPI001B35B4C3|nr:hypothetical protein [Micromonospora sp. C95]MBQ1023693.1 hypothetical protein [Micromonospora sp. C95]